MKKINNLAIPFFMLIGTTLLSSHELRHKTIQTTSNYLSETFTRISCLKCLSESIYFLSRLYKNNYHYKPCNCISQTNCIQIDATLFFHSKIKNCLQKMLHTESLKPILILLNEAKHYPHLYNHHFVRETFMLIFTIHKQILLRECAEHQQPLKKTTLNTILEIGEKIDQLPIAEVLSAIDMLMVELPPLLEKYELQSAITWKNWLKKYWWVPPVFGGWFSLKILLNFQRSYFYYNYRHTYPTYSRPPRIFDTEITDPELLAIMRKKNEPDQK